jgi:ABC-type antimicrobial peptide transport system permease subunit
MMSIHVRAQPGAAQILDRIRQELWALDPNVALNRPSPLSARLGTFLLAQRYGAALIGLFGLIGLVLVAIGVYGVLAFQIAQRAREISIRLALGATVRGVLGFVLRRGAILALTGTAVGLLLAAAATRLVQAHLFGVSPLDPLTFMAVAPVLLLLLVALLASYIPARRATRISPMEVMRAE